MKNIIIGIIIGGIIFTLGGVVAATTISSKNVIYQNKTVNTALDELYDNAITGKELVAAAITNKGISTTSTDTYQTMATNINNIDTNHTEINQKISNLESKHNTDIASLTGSISNLNSNFSKDATWVDLSQNLNSTNVASVTEYVRYTIKGNICILDIGGITFSKSGGGIAWLTLPDSIIPKTRTVSLIAYDFGIVNGQNTVAMVYNNVGHNVVFAHVPTTSASFYGQMIWQI